MTNLEIWGTLHIRTGFHGMKAAILFQPLNFKLQGRKLGQWPEINRQKVFLSVHRQGLLSFFWNVYYILTENSFTVDIP